MKRLLAAIFMSMRHSLLQPALATTMYPRIRHNSLTIGWTRSWNGRNRFWAI